MNTQKVVRILLGVGFGGLGYYLAVQFLTIEEANTQMGIRLIIALVAGAIGVFLVPIVSEWIKTGSTLLARRIATEVISQLRIPNIGGVGRIPTRIRENREKRKENSKHINPVVVDTSALIDGRIAEVVESGFFYGSLIIPRFVLSELQHIADASNALRRGRGRRGLDILERLKKAKAINTTIYNKEVEGKNIDDKLLQLAKQMKAKILTTDFNLNKVATVSGIKILNINELVNALKTTLLPGEPLEVKVISEGKEKTQGVGYLQDGTMIVVENGAKFVGKSVPTKVLRVLQTAAGRMIFVQAEGEGQKQST